MVSFNYTRVKRRDKKIYSLFNTPVSKTGISMKILYTCLGCLAIFNIFGILFCIMTGKIWYNPLMLAQTSATGYFYIVFIMLPIGIGIALNTLKVQNYKLIDYLKIYFTPKIPLDQNGKKLKIDGYNIDTFIEDL